MRHAPDHHYFQQLAASPAGHGHCHQPGHLVHRFPLRQPDGARAAHLLRLRRARFWAIFLLAHEHTPKSTEKGAIAGFLSGTLAALLHLGAVTLGWLHYGSVMNANFHGAIYAFVTASAVGWLASTPDPSRPANNVLVFHWRTGSHEKGDRLLWVLSAILLSACLLTELDVALVSPIADG